jgi:serine phosphatase RsbU (regulator of sigma subunit)
MNKGYFIITFKIVVINILLLLSVFAFAQNAKIDSLKSILPTAKDFTRVQVLVELCWEYRNVQSDSAISYGNQAIALSSALEKYHTQAKVYAYLCFIYGNKGDYATALSMGQQGLELSEKIDDKEQMGFALQNLAEINGKLENYKQAVEYAIKALQSFESINHLNGIAFCYLTLGNIHSEENDLSKAHYYYKKALETRKKQKNIGGIATATNLLGVILTKQGQYKEALEYLSYALAIYFQQKNRRGIAYCSNNIAKAQLGKNALDSTIFFAKQGIEIAQNAGFKQVLQESYETLSQVYAQRKDFAQAYQYQKLFIAYRDSIFNEEKFRRLQELQNRYQNEKQKHEIDMLKADNQRKNLLNSIFIGGFVLIFGLVFALWRGNRLKKKANKLLKSQHHEIKEKSVRLLELNEELKQTNEELNINLEVVNQQNGEIQRKNEIIEKKNKDLADSINYAKRIQMAILPTNNDLKKYFKDCFVLFKPKDVVSGDFYWTAHKEDKVLIAVVDCTGHGVPGAFMSMISNDLLNLIVHEKEIHEVDVILAEMNKLIRVVLKQDETDSKDGLEMAICSLDIKNKRLTYAGAMNPLYYILESQAGKALIEIKADKVPIGGYELKKEHFFTKHTFDLKESMVFYLFSDGYADQFGGADDKKFLVKRFKELLFSVHHLPMETQQQILEKTLVDWMHNQKQVDDITVIGIRI